MGFRIVAVLPLSSVVILCETAVLGSHQVQRPESEIDGQLIGLVVGPRNGFVLQLALVTWRLWVVESGRASMFQSRWC